MVKCVQRAAPPLHPRDSVDTHLGSGFGVPDMTPRNDLALADRLRRLLPAALLGLAGLALALPAPVVAETTASPAAPTGWKYDWRPGWLPGDPAEPRFDLLSAPWARSLASPGVFVALDPVTRLPVRPSADQRRALSAALLGASIRSDAPLPTHRIPGGGEMVHLPEGFEVFLVARRNAQGGFTIDCATDPGARDSGESDPAAASPPPREER